MIEVTLELKLDSFLVNTVGGSGELAGKAPSKAVKFVCERILSAQKLADNAPTAEFEFLGSANQQAAAAGTAKGFDDKLYEYVTTLASGDLSRVTVSSIASGYTTMPKGASTGEIGRMMFTRLPEQSRVLIELVLNDNEFDAVWKLTSEQDIRHVIATLVCFEVKQANLPPNSIVVGIASSSLQLMARSGR
jgi:hypothetical protein